MRARMDELAGSADGTAPHSAEEVALMERLGELERAVSQDPEAPANVLTEGEFPGSIHLPGTNLSNRVGGFVRLGTVASLDPIGSDDRFIVGSIPAEGLAAAEDEPRNTISAKRSRLNLDVRMDSSVGRFRAFLEGDFAGDGGTESYRLRHAYGQYNKLLLGQTWSTFMDLASIPEELDFEGLSAQINVRHPQLRWAELDLVGQNWAFALEDPTPSFTGGNGVSKFADVAMNTSWTRDGRHLQLGLLLRTLSGRPILADETEGREDDAFGYGMSLSGSVALRRRQMADNIKWQLVATFRF